MKIGVAGLGLIGGSIFKDLKALGYDVIGVSKSQKGENIYDNYEVLKTCNLVFVCSAMNKTLEILDKLEDILSPDTVVTDVCSLKEFVCRKSRPRRTLRIFPCGTASPNCQSGVCSRNCRAYNLSHKG